MSFEGLQERLTVLQETASQLRKLIDKLASLDSPDDNEGAEDDSGGGSAEELGAEINQVLREQEEDLELLQEEITDLRPGRPGSEAEHGKNRLRDGARRLEGELKA
jgi:protein transport protein SEC20